MNKEYSIILVRNMKEKMIAFYNNLDKINKILFFIIIIITIILLLWSLIVTIIVYMKPSL